MYNKIGHHNHLSQTSSKTNVVLGAWMGLINKLWVYILFKKCIRLIQKIVGLGEWNSNNNNLK